MNGVRLVELDCWDSERFVYVCVYRWFVLLIGEFPEVQSFATGTPRQQRCLLKQQSRLDGLHKFILSTIYLHNAC